MNRAGGRIRTERDAPPARRARRLWWSLLVVVLVLGGLYAADRIILARTVADLQDQIHTAVPETSPEVDIDVDGVLFVPQLLGGTIERAQVSIPWMRIDDLHLEDVHIELQQIAVREPYRAESVRASATAPGDTVATAVREAGVPEQISVTVAGAELVAQASVLGVPAQVVLIPEPAGRALQLSVGQASLGGVQVDVDELPAVLAEGLSGIEVELTGLPEGLELTGITMREDRLDLVLQGDQIVFDDL